MREVAIHLLVRRGGGGGLEDFDCFTKKFLILVLNFRKFLFLLGLFYGVSKRGNFKDFMNL